MMLFFIFGALVTLLIVAVGALAWVLLDRKVSSGGSKRRHREEARRLQESFEGDDDFTRNFHRPTQNELLETLQALDYLSADWEKGDPTLVGARLKNELAESFPDLRKLTCDYPRPIEEDVARLAGKKKLSPEALEARRTRLAEETARARTQFHAARAQANAHHQMTSGPEAAPVEVEAGSLPFRLSDQAAGRFLWPAWAKRLAVTAALAFCLAAASLYATQNPGLRGRLHGLTQGGEKPPTDQQTPHLPTLAKTGANGASSSPEAAPIIAGVPNPDGNAPPAATVEDYPVPAAAAVAGSAPAPAAPPPVAVPPRAAAPPSPTLAQLVAYSKARAVDKHPDLMEPNTEMNLRFVFRYKKLAEEKSPRLQDPNWPEKLADECAAAAAGSSTKPRKVSQTGR